RTTGRGVAQGGAGQASTAAGSAGRLKACDVAVTMTSMAGLLPAPPAAVGRLAPMRTDVPMARVRANGRDIGYDEPGDGPPLVLLHSASSSGREDFAAQLPLLRRSFHCYLPDARGHATTRWDAADGFRYDWTVADLEAFADAMGLATFPLLGFSTGRRAALQLGGRQT